MKISSEFIGKICIKSIRDAILNFKLSKNDTIVLNSINFDDLVLEHREVYGESITIPFFLLGIQIKEASSQKVTRNKIMIIKNNPFAINKNILNDIEEEAPFEEYFRCGWCGSIVDFDGSELSLEDINYKIKIIEKFDKFLTVKTVTGYCCKNRG